MRTTLLCPRRSTLAASALALATTLVSPPSRAAEADPDPWFSSDKALHFGVSAGIAAGSYAAAATVFEARAHALLVGGGVALTAGAAKEAIDLAGYGTPSWRDFAWDVAGTLVGLGLAWTLDLAIRGTGDRHPPLSAPRAASALVIRF